MTEGEVNHRLLSVAEFVCLRNRLGITSRFRMGSGTALSIHSGRNLPKAIFMVLLNPKAHLDPSHTIRPKVIFPQDGLCKTFERKKVAIILNSRGEEFQEQWRCDLIRR